jgi:hypothetical protein
LGGTNPSRTELIVKGALSSNGTPTNRIVFKSSRPTNPGPGDWQGIIADNAANLTLNYTTIEHAVDAIVGFEGSSVALNNCNIFNCYSGITCFYPYDANIEGTDFENCAGYAIHVQNLEARIDLTGITILGGFMDGIRYFGNAPELAMLKLDVAEIVKDPTYEGAGIYIAPDEETGERPICVISNVSIQGFEQGICISEGLNGTQVGPNVNTIQNIEGILLDGGDVKIDGSEGANKFDENELAALLARSSGGKVRHSYLIGGRLAVDIEKDGDVIDFGRDNPQEEWGLNYIVEGTGGSEMLMFVRECTIEYPAQMNWWGSDDPQYIESMVSGCVIWDPFLPEPPEIPKLTAEEIELPKRLTIPQAHPNPFNANVTIKFTAPKSTMVSVKIYNLLGQEICEPYNEYTQAGETSIIWDGRDNSGRGLASGVYLYAVRTDDEVRVNKMMLLK